MEKRMPQNVRLFRVPIRQELKHIRRKWKKLGYPDFVLRAEYTMNPERSNEPENNFSEAEATDAWLAPIPISQRPVAIQTSIDQFGRPDKYAVDWCKRWRTIAWNQNIEHANRQIFVIKIQVTEITAGTKRNPQGKMKEVYHNYLRSLRGRDFVNQIDKHFDDGIDGLQEGKNRIQAGLNTRACIQSVEERLRWQEGRSP